MHTLICDDDASTRFVMRRFLEQNFGCTVRECSDGVEALQCMAREKFAFVVIDLEMPTMDGIDTLEEIRQSPDTKDTPVVILSRERHQDAVVKLMRLGITDYILKPPRNEVVVEKIGQLIRSLPPSAGGSTDRHAIRLSPMTPCLLAEGNLNYRTFFAGQAKRYGTVIPAESGAAAIATFRRSPVNLVFIGSELGVVSAERLAQRLRAMQVAGLRIVRVVDGDEAVDPQVFDEVLRRSYVPATFRATLGPYVQIPGPLSAVSALVPEIRSIVSSAARQVFGMMFDAEIGTAITDGASGMDFGCGVTIDLTDRFVLKLGIHLSRAAGGAVTSKMFGCPVAEAVDEDIASAAGELGNLLAGRIHAQFCERGHRAAFALPQIRDSGVLPPLDEGNGLTNGFAIPGAGDFFISMEAVDLLEQAAADTRAQAEATVIAGAEAGPGVYDTPVAQASGF